MNASALFQHRSNWFRPLIIVPAVVLGVLIYTLSTSATAADASHEMGKIKTPELNETSGLAVSRQNPDVLWLHNDGDSAKLFAVSLSGKLVAVAKCRAKIDDMEEIALGPGPKPGADYLYLGDIGDNAERRREIRVARVPEPDVSGERGQELVLENAEEFQLAYPDGPHDAEAMFVDSLRGELCIVTKEKKRARLYFVPLDQLLEKSVAKLQAGGAVDVEEVSAGAISRDGRRILLRREGQGWLWNRAEGESVATALSRKPTSVPVLGKRQGPNGESISFSPSGDAYFTVSEGKKQAIYRFDLSALGQPAER
jgi:hypothetical protein